LAAASYRISETATMKSVATLVMPQAPRPVAKKVPSPKKGPLAPDGDDGDGAAGLDAGGCWCEDDVGEGAGAGAGVELVVGEWVGTMGEGAGTVGVGEGADEEGGVER